MLKYKERRPEWTGGLWEQFIDLTGVTVNEFEEYLPHFAATYHERYPSEETGASMNVLPEMEDKLLLVWMHHKMQVTPSILGQQFGLDPAQTNECIAHLLPVLELTYSRLAIPRLSPFCIHFLQGLHTNQVEYLVVGGHAVAFHGYLRPIMDFDILISRHPANAQKLISIMESYGYEIDQRIGEFFQTEERVIRVGMPPFTVNGLKNRFIQLGTEPKQLEILTSISAVNFEEAYPERVSGSIDGTPVQVIGLNHLKRNKQAGIRPKDADDLAHLI
jgi:hypothetical protein